MRVWERLAEMVAAHGGAAMVSVHAVKGSTPREAGARLIVRPDGAFHGTIGGGQLEWEALAQARRSLERGERRAQMIDRSLGPDLGQCCGGRVTLLIETFDRRDADELARLAQAEDEGAAEALCSFRDDGRVRRVPEGARPAGGTEGRAVRSAGPLPSRHADGSGAGELRWTEPFGESRTPLLLFGAGHVGRALVLALAPLPFRVRWIDGREDAFPSHMPANVTPVRSGAPEAELALGPPGAFVLVMTHAHPLDLAITAAALGRSDLPFVGLIGSATKQARFERRFRAAGLAENRIASLVCPIGLPGIRGKEPAVIAASVTAQLLQERERLARGAEPNRRAGAGEGGERPSVEPSMAAPHPPRLHPA